MLAPRIYDLDCGKKYVNFAPAEKIVNLNVGPFQSPNFFSNQNWTRIGPKSDHEANADIFTIIGRGGVFEDLENRKAINKPETGSMTRLKYMPR